MSNETKHEEDQLILSNDLSIPLSCATTTFAILGKRGSGKSNTGVVLAEEMYRTGIPWVTIDPKGDWWGIRSSECGKKSGLKVLVFGGVHGDLPIYPDQGALIADIIVDKGMTCVVDVSDFETSKDRNQFLADFATQLYKRHRRSPHIRHVFLEEAHMYIPQQVTKDTAYVKHAMSNIPLLGRTFGLGCTSMSQRSAKLHKDILTQSDTLIAMRTTGPHDKLAIKEWVKEQDGDNTLINSLASLEDGEAWVWSPQALKVKLKTHINRRSTYDSGAAPTSYILQDSAVKMSDINLDDLKLSVNKSLNAHEADDEVANNEISDVNKDLLEQNEILEKTNQLLKDNIQELKIAKTQLQSQLSEIYSAVNNAEKTHQKINSIFDNLNSLSTKEKINPVIYGVTTGHLKVLSIINKHSNGKGVDVNIIAKETGLSDGTVYQYCSKLKQKEFVCLLDKLYSPTAAGRELLAFN